MRGFWPIYKRELLAFFVTPLAWVLIVTFLVVQGMHFYLLVDHFAQAADVAGDETPLSAFFGNTVLLYLVVFVLVPPMTMRLFAEERRSGTIETLMTAPVSSSAVVLAKYGAAVTTYVAMWLPTVLYLVILRRTGDLDGHAAASAYTGVLLVGAAYLSIGLCASALTRSQFLAMIWTALVLLVLFILGIGEFVAREGTLMHDVCSHVSVWAHMNDFASGVVDSRRLVFYGSLVALSLFVANRAVDSWSARPRQSIQLLGVAAAVVLAAVVNMLGARHFARWDWTRDKRWSLSPATTETLRTVEQHLDLWAVVGPGDPLEQSLRQLLLAYRAATPRLEVHFVDPDRDAVQLLDLQRRFGLEAGRTEDGRVATDAIVIVAAGDKHWFLTPQDMVDPSGDDVHVRPREERALTQAIRSVLGGEKVKLCFTSGHGELSLEPGKDDRDSLGGLRNLLEKANYELATVDATPPGAHEPFGGCGVVVIAGARAPFAPTESNRLRTWLLDGGSLLAAVGPIESNGDTGMTPAGLDDVLAPFGIAFDDDLVHDLDEAVSIPDTHGEGFLATPRPHAVTAALVPSSGDPHPPRVMVLFSRSLRHVAPPGAAAASDLLVTSGAAFAKTSILGASTWTEAPPRGPEDPGGPFVLAMASERAAAKGAAHGPRVVAVGSRFALAESNWQEPGSLHGAAFFADSALSWLSARPGVVDVPDKPEVAAGMRVTEEGRRDVRLYVLVFMPLAALLLGASVWTWRRSLESRPYARPRRGRSP